MATGKVVGQIQVTQGNIKVLGVDGAVREPGYEGYVYENEQVISNDPNALFQIKFLALPEASAYDGIFRILADGSVIHGRDAMDSMMSDENLVKVLEATASKEVSPDDLETAAGEEGAEGSSSFTETDIVAESSVLGFSRGANGALGFGITDFGRLPNYDAGQITPPAITSPNVVIYDENGTEPVIQVSATAEGSVTYGINGLDSDLFNIDSATGLVTFKESPDFENPRDSGGDNEYNTYVTATDSFGNYTTQLLSVSINNLNEAVTAFDDAVDAVEDSILYSTIDLDANDTDLDGNALSVGAGTYTTAQGGEIVIAADGSYVYTPLTNFNGVDSVNYTVTDGEFSDVGTLTINVAPANDAPVAVDDAVSAVEDTVLNSAIDLDANDYDVDGDALSVVSGTFTTANGGQLVLASDGTYTYTPAANFNGVDSVNYTVTDGELNDVGTLTINVAAVDDTPPPPPPPPIDYTFADANESVSGDEGIVQTGTVLENATDDNGLVLSVTAFTVDDTTYNAGDTATIVGKGSLTIGSDGTYTFEPEANYNGEVPVATYTVSNGETTDTSTLTIYVNAVSDEFTDIDEYTSGIEDAIQTGTVLENATDDNGLPLSVTEFRIDGDEATYNADDTAIIADVGSLTIGSDGTYTFEPVDNYSGDVPTITYTVSNGETTDSSALTITVDAAADVPMLSMEIIETPKTEIVTEYQTVIDTERNEEAGIYLGEDGKYYIDTTEVIDGVVYKGNGPTLNNGHYITYEQTIELADVVVLNTRFTGQSNATVKFFEGETLVDELPLLGGLNTYTPSGSFDSILFVVDEQTSAIFLKSYSFEKIITTETQPYTMEVPVETEVVTYEYTLSSDSELTDDDEELGEVQWDGVPDEFDLIDNGDGTYTFESDEQLNSDILDGITASVTSSENSNGDEATITVNQNGIVSIESGSGNDTLMGEDGDEVIDGGDGNDYIDGGEGSDTIYAGGGDDTMVYDDSDVEIDGGEESDILVANSEIVDLSNVSNIEVIQLNSGATVTGTGDADSINADDVMSATDGGVLIIQSDDGDASTQAYADSTFGDATTVVIDGSSYAQYVDGDATLLIQIEDIIEPL